MVEPVSHKFKSTRIIHDEETDRQMELTDAQKDAIAELVNIGFGRAASALSMLVGQRVILEVPQVTIRRVDELQSSLSALSRGEITSVHQVFDGLVCGNAMLLLDNESAATLVDLLNGGEGKAHPLTEKDHETLIETGNILLNAFIGSFGNLLKVHVSFAVPHLRLDSLKKMIETLLVENQEVEFAMIVRVHFWLVKGDVSGHVVLVMGIQSMDALLEAMKSAGYLEKK